MTNIKDKRIFALNPIYVFIPAILAFYIFAILHFTVKNDIQMTIFLITVFIGFATYTIKHFDEIFSVEEIYLLNCSEYSKRLDEI